MKTREYLMDSDIDELMEDWFDRDGETFVKVSSKHRVGWEETLREGEAYSSYLIESPTKIELIKRAYSLAQDMITVMNIPFKVQVVVSRGSRLSATDGKILQVATTMFDDDDITVGEQLDAFLGTTIHEGCHLLYTDFEALERRRPNNIVKMLANVIEDERIEQLLGQDKPGLARFLEKSKYYWFDREYLKTLEEDDNLFVRLLNIFLRIMRYPTYLQESDIVFFGHHLFAVKDVVKELPKDTDGSITQAEKVFEIFKEFYKERDEEEKSREEGEASEGGETGEGESREGESSGGGLGSEGSSGEEGEEEGEDTKEAKKEPSTIEEDAEKIVSELLSKGMAGKHLSYGDVSMDLDSTTGSIVEGTLTVGKDAETFFEKAKENKYVYQDSYHRVRRYIPAIAQILSGHFREYKLVHKSMRSGVLDTTKLAEAYQGVSTVYMREGEVKTDRVAVVVLIDESGSMHGRRIQAARDTAILINEAVGRTPQVELFIYGHTGDEIGTYSTDLKIYREKGFRKKYALGDVGAHYQNRDGVAIHEVATRVRKQTKLPVLMFVLSDGAPAAGKYTGTKAVTHVRESVKKVEKMGVSVIQVCISRTYDPATMFDHFVVLEDMSRLAIDLGKVIKKATLKAATIRVS